MPRVRDMYKRGDIIEYMMSRFDTNDKPYQVKCRGRVNCVYTNGVINFTNIWAETVGHLYQGMTETKQARHVRKLTDDEIMIWKLEN